jgi:hypothetical protein
MAQGEVGMRVFFGLSPAFARVADYESGVRALAQRYDLVAVFAHEMPKGAEPVEWLTAQLADCQFAFFDFTGLSADVAFAYGVARQSDDVTSVALIDPDQHEKLVGKSSAHLLSADWIAAARAFYGASDFQRRAHLVMDEQLGPKRMRDQKLVARIKEEITKKGPIHMRQIANGVGRNMGDIQPVVYDLVREGAVRKISDKRWAQYSVH